MRSHRRRLICQWLGVVILVLWGMSFVRGLSIGWNLDPASQSSRQWWDDRGSIMTMNGLVHITLELPRRDGLQVKLLRPKWHRILHTTRHYLVGRYSNSRLSNKRSLIIPTTIPLGLSAGLIGISFWRRNPKGHCPKCGYDLTGITDKCPECGRMVRAGAP